MQPPETTIGQALCTSDSMYGNHQKLGRHPPTYSSYSGVGGYGSEVYTRGEAPPALPPHIHGSIMDASGSSLPGPPMHMQPSSSALTARPPSPSLTSLSLDLGEGTNAGKAGKQQRKRQSTRVASKSSTAKENNNGKQKRSKAKSCAECIRLKMRCIRKDMEVQDSTSKRRRPPSIAPQEGNGADEPSNTNLAGTSSIASTSAVGNNQSEEIYPWPCEGCVRRGVKELCPGGTLETKHRTNTINATASEDGSSVRAGSEANPNGNEEKDGSDQVDELEEQAEPAAKKRGRPSL